MKAMILAAGYGTRLIPLTDERPKPLVPVGNRAVIDRIITHLIDHGVDDIVVNAHHHHHLLADHLDGGRPFGVPLGQAPLLHRFRRLLTRYNGLITFVHPLPRSYGLVRTPESVHAGRSALHLLPPT